MYYIATSDLKVLEFFELNYPHAGEVKVNDQLLGRFNACQSDLHFSMNQLISSLLKLALYELIVYSPDVDNRVRVKSAKLPLR